VFGFFQMYRSLEHACAPMALVTDVRNQMRECGPTINFAEGQAPSSRSKDFVIGHSWTQWQSSGTTSPGPFVHLEFTPYTSIRSVR